MNKRIAITGVGTISYLGVGVKETWRNLLKSSIHVEHEKYTFEGDPVEQCLIHKIKDFDTIIDILDDEKIAEISSWNKDALSDDLMLFLASIKLAIEDGQLTDENLVNEAFQENKT